MTELAALRQTGQAAARELLDDTSLARLDGGLRQYRELRLRVIANQRSALLSARASGQHDSRELARALDTLDAEQIMVELRTASIAEES